MKRQALFEAGVVAYGILPVAALLVDAIVRLLPKALALVDHSFSLIELCGLGASFLFFGTVEGYKGFQCGFSPRVVARAFALRDGKHPWLIALAPLFTMALVSATPRRLFTNWALIVMIVGFVIALTVTPDPWRGIVDAGVVVGLTWGLVSLVVFFVRAVLGRVPAVDLAWPNREH